MIKIKMWNVCKRNTVGPYVAVKTFVKKEEAEDYLQEKAKEAAAKGETVSCDSRGVLTIGGSTHHNVKYKVEVIDVEI